MTREEKIAAKNQLLADINALVREYNELMLDAKGGEAKSKDDDIQSKVKEYNQLSATICYDDCLACENPMLEAVRMLTYDTVKLTDEKNDISAIATRHADPATKAIDLLSFDRYASRFPEHKSGVGKDPKWSAYIEQLNFQLTLRTANELGVDPTAINNSYAMSELARETTLGKNPTSNTQLLKTLQLIVTAMIGEEYKPLSKDVTFLMRTYARKGRKALQVACSDHKKFTSLIAEICYRIVTDETYTVDFKIRKGN